MIWWLICTGILKTILYITMINYYKARVILVQREPLMSDLMREADDIASRRKALQEKRDLLFRAVEIVNKVNTNSTHI